MQKAVGVLRFFQKKALGCKLKEKVDQPEAQAYVSVAKKLLRTLIKKKTSPFKFSSQFSRVPQRAVINRFGINSVSALSLKG